MTKMYIFFLFTLILGLEFPLKAQHPMYQHPRDILLFADDLFQQGDYYRAITEYKRALFYFPTYEKKDLISYMIGKSYYMGGKYRAALNYLAPLTELENDSIRLDVKNLVGLSYLYRKDFVGAERVFKEIVKENNELPGLDNYFLLISMAQFNQKNFAKSEESFREFLKKYPDSRFKTLAEQGQKDSKLVKEFSPRSVWLATSLSVILPGAGQAYNREWSNAFVSFIFNATLGFLTVRGLLNDDYVSAGIFGSLFVTFYAGNIYQARRSTIKYNQDFVDKKINALNREFERLKFQNAKTNKDDISMHWKSDQRFELNLAALIH